jgi:hypothetical protein
MFQKIKDWTSLSTSKRVFMFSDEKTHETNLLGRKVINLCELTQIGLSVPPGTNNDPLLTPYTVQTFYHKLKIFVYIKFRVYHKRSGGERIFRARVYLKIFERAMPFRYNFIRENNWQKV